jgi:hypothetical protein
MMEAICFSETLLTIYQNTRRHFPDNNNVFHIMPLNCSSQDKLPTILISTTSHQDPFFYNVRMRNLFISIDLSEAPVYKTIRRYNKKTVILLFAIVTILFFTIYIRFLLVNFIPSLSKNVHVKISTFRKKEHKETKWKQRTMRGKSGK